MSAEPGTIDTTLIGDPTKCDGVLMRQITYKHLRVPAPDDRCDPGSTGTDGRCLIDLKGWLYVPAEPLVANRPAIIFEHGHEQSRGEPCAVVEYFTQQHYVVFAPLRRGHDTNDPDFYGADMRSTGLYIEDFVNLGGTCALPGCDPDLRSIQYVIEETKDVQTAVTHLQKEPLWGTEGSALFIPLVDPARITLLGHSFGGSVVTFANTLVTGHMAAIAVSGAELEWRDPLNNPNGSPWYKVFFATFAPFGSQPFLYIQPANGKSVLAMQFLADLLVPLRKQVLFALFPDAPYCGPSDPSCCSTDPVCKQVHSRFVGVDREVQNWAPVVQAYIEREVGHAASPYSTSCRFAQ